MSSTQKPQAQSKAASQNTTADHIQDPLSAFKQQLPGIGQKLLGKRYQNVTKLAGYVVSQDTMDRLTGQLFDQSLNVAGHLHKMTRRLAKSTPDPSQAANQAEAALRINRLIAAFEGGATGLAGLPGAIADLPLLFLLSLRTIHQTADAYGVDLSGDDGRQLIYDVLGQADLSLLGEKQGILLGIGGVSQFIQGGGMDEFRQTLSSEQNGELAQKIIAEASKIMPRLSPSLVSRFGALAGGATGVVYNVRIISAVAAAAQKVFASKQPAGLLEQKDRNAVSAPAREIKTDTNAEDISKATTASTSGKDSTTQQPVELGQGVVAHSDVQQMAAIAETGELDAAKTASASTATTSLIDGATHMASDVIDKVVQVAVQAQETVAQHLHEVNQPASTGAAQQADDEPKGTGKTGKDGQQSAGQTQAKPATETSDNRLNALKTQAQDKVAELSEKVSDAVHAAMDTVTEQASDIKDQVTAARDNMTSKAAEMAVQAEDAVREGTSQAQNSDKKPATKAATKANEQPKAESSTANHSNADHSKAKSAATDHAADHQRSDNDDASLNSMLEQFSAQVEADIIADDAGDDHGDHKPRKRTVHVHQNAEGEFEADQPIGKKS